MDMVRAGLSPSGARVQKTPWIEAVNSAAVRGVSSADVDITRQVLLAIIANLALDEEAREKPMPSTRALAHLQPKRRLHRKRA
jgi:hypothetical protein